MINRLFWCIESLVGSAWRPNDYSTEFRRQAARDGYMLARIRSLFRGDQVKR